MTDEEIVETMARAMAVDEGRDPDEPAFVQYPGPRYLGVCWRDNYASKSRAALSIAKPLIAGDAREMALKEAMIAVQGVINGRGPHCGAEPHVSLYNAKAAILALSNNPEVGG